jgi:hypothetical protein
MPTNNQNQSQSGLEDDIKTPNMGQPGKGAGFDEESVTETSSGLDDGDEALEQEDEDLDDLEGDHIDDLGEEAENDAGFDAGAKGQPR